MKQASFQRYQPYYYLSKVSPLAHRFVLYYNYHCIALFTWDGTTLTKTSDSFGEHYDESGMQDRVPSELQSVQPLIQANIQANESSCVEGDPIFHALMYCGYYSEYTVTKLVLLHHEVMPDHIPRHPNLKVTEWDHAVTSTVTIRFGPPGATTTGTEHNIKVPSTGAIQVSITMADVVKVSDHILDYFTTVDRHRIEALPHPGLDIQGNEASPAVADASRDMKLLHAGLVDYCGISPADKQALIAAVQLPSVSLADFNLTHGLKEEVALTTFEKLLAPITFTQ